MEFLQSILGVIIGGAITLITTIMINNHQKSLDRNKRKLEKIEKAYELLSKVEHSYRMTWISDIATLKSGKYEDQYRIKEKLPFDEIEMLIGFYAPEFREDASEFVNFSKSEYGKLTSKVSGIESISIDQAQVEILKTQLNETFNCILERIHSLKEKLAETGRNL